MKTKFWPSGHSSVYTFVLGFKSQKESLRAQKTIERRAASPAEFRIQNWKSSKGALKDIYYAKRVREGRKLYVYSEFETDFYPSTFSAFLKWAGLHPKLDVHYSDYPEQSVRFRYSIPLSNRQRDIAKALPLLMSDERPFPMPDKDWDIIRSLIQSGKMLKVDISGLLFGVSGTYCYNPNAKGLYLDLAGIDARMNRLSFENPWELLSVRHWMKYPPRTE